MPPLIRGGRGIALAGALTSASIAGGLFLPLTLVYFTALTRVPLPLLGALITLAGLLTLPLPVLAGWLVQRIGARTVAVGALCLQAVGFAGFVVVREPVGILIASAAASCGSRLFWSSVFELVAEHAAADGLPGPERWFALLNVLRTIGIVAGGLIAGAALAADSAAVDIGLAAASGAGYLLAAGLLAVGGRRGARRPPPTEPRGMRLVLREHGFVGLLALNIVFATATLFAGLALPTVVRSAVHAPGWVTALLLVGNALLVALLGRRGGVLAERRPARDLLIAASVLWAAAFLLLGAAALAGRALSWALTGLAAGVVLLSLAEVLHSPSSNSWVARMTPASRRPARLALFQYSWVAAELIGPVLFTGGFSAWPPLPFLVLAGAALAAAALLAVGRSFDSREAR